MVVADDLSTSLIVGVSCSATLAWVCITDLRERLIPNRALIFGSLPALIAVAIFSPDLLAERFLWTACAALPFGIIAWFKPGSMGMGDAKLIGFLGFCLGPATVAAVGCALVAGGVAGAFLFARHGLAARKRTIPFAPYLALGSVVGPVINVWASQITHLASS